MGKYSFVSKERRAQIQDRKRATHGDPVSGKLKQRKQPTSISGKRKRKLFKKWRREQKESVQNGLITMEDIEMAVAEGTSQGTNEKSQMKFNMKKHSRLKIKKLKGKGKKSKPTASPTAVDSVDVMVE